MSEEKLLEKKGVLTTRKIKYFKKEEMTGFVKTVVVQEI